MSIDLPEVARNTVGKLLPLVILVALAFLLMKLLGGQHLPDENDPSSVETSVDIVIPGESTDE